MMNLRPVVRLPFTWLRAGFSIVLRIKYRVDVAIHRMALSFTLRVSESAGRWIRARADRRGARPEPLAWRPGVSVVTLASGEPGAFFSCLEALFVSLEQVGEPFEVIAVCDGRRRRGYVPVLKRFPGVNRVWMDRSFRDSAAISRGVGMARHDWVYLLDGDMALAPDALETILRARRPNVFAISSRRLPAVGNAPGRETGWTDMKVENHEARVVDLEPEDSFMTRGTVAAGAGASLFHRPLLHEMIRALRPSNPYHREDVDWSLRAWRMGYEALFQPESVARRHPGGASSAPGEGGDIHRIKRRNDINVHLRNPTPGEPSSERLDLAGSLDPRTCLKLGSWRNCASMLRGRIHAWKSHRHDLDLSSIPRKFYSSEFDAGDSRPGLLAASPFQVYPPHHGGAVRIHHLLKALSREFRVILLSDEGILYSREHLEEPMRFLSSIHLVPHRPPESKLDATNRTRRIEHHSHPALRRELRRLMDSHRPAAVQLENIEISRLVDESTGKQPFVLSLQDVLLTPDDPGQKEDDDFEKAMIAKFDDVFVCSEEDAALLDVGVKIIPNGVDPDMDRYVSSRGAARILFAGPFRAELNWIGVRRFLQHPYKTLLDRVPGLGITIVGGAGARERIEGLECFRQPGVRVVENVDDMRPLLDASALTINPMVEQRGSSLKVIESLSAGRVCVSTDKGARGYLDVGFPSLVTAETIESFSAPIEKLLTDEPYRLSIETPRPDLLEPFSWRRSGAALAHLLKECIRKGRGGRFEN